MEACVSGRFRLQRDGALGSFFRVVGWVLLPVVVFITGMALLWTWMTALIWFGMIVGIAYAYLRFFEKHNEHEAYDDRLTPDMYHEGLQTYIGLLEKEKEQQSVTKSRNE